MPTTKINDINMYYELLGDGPPLVMISGLGTDISEFAWLTELFAKENRVLAFDNRGAGQTDKPESPYSIEMMANDAHGLINKLKFPKANVLGFSMGGRIALELTLKYPEVVNKLVLVSAAARVVKSWRRYFIFYVIHRLPPLRGRQPRHAFIQQSQATLKYDCTKMLPQITTPTLIMHGEKDKIARLALAKELHAGIKGSRLKIFKGGHLFFMLRERARFMKEANNFLHQP